LQINRKLYHLEFDLDHYIFFKNLLHADTLAGFDFQLAPTIGLRAGILY